MTDSERAKAAYRAAAKAFFETLREECGGGAAIAALAHSTHATSTLMSLGTEGMIGVSLRCEFADVIRVGSKGGN